MTEKFEIVGKRSVQLLSVGVILHNGERYVTDKETEEMKRAKKQGLIDYKSVVEPKVDKPAAPVVPEDKLREAAKDLGVKDHDKMPVAELKKLVETKVAGTTKVKG